MITVIVTITGSNRKVYIVLIVIVTITWRFICSISIYCDNNDNNGEVYMHCLQLLYNYGNSGDVYMQC